MATVRDAVKASLRLIGAIGRGDTPSAEELTDAMAAMSRMLSSWSTEDLLIFNKIREEFLLVAGQETYTMGPGGNFNTEAPVDIPFAELQVQTTSPTYEYPLNIIPLSERAEIHLKDLQSNLPRDLYVENTAPLAKLTLYPVPNYAHKLVTYSHKQILTITNASMVLNLPAGYEQAIVYGLALVVAPEYRASVSDDIRNEAARAKAVIKRKNWRPTYLKTDPALMGQGGRPYNIFTGGRD